MLGARIDGMTVPNTTNRSRRSDRHGDLAVGARLAEWDFLQLTPDLPLKRRRLDIDRYLSVRRCPFDRGDDIANPTGQCAGRIADARPPRRRVLALERRLERAGIVSECDRANAAIGGADEQAAERAVDDHVIDLHPRAAAAVCGRRHAEP